VANDEEVFEVPVGRSRKGIRAKLCKTGYAKLLKHFAKLQYRKSEGKSTRGDPLRASSHIKRNPYIFARYRDAATGKDLRTELGRWLLDSRELPVIHLNGDSLDFRLDNLKPQESARQKARHERAAAKRAKRDRRSAEWAAKRALRPPTKPDGLTPEGKVAAILDKKFQRKLRKRAGAIIGDPLRAEKVVDELVAGSIQRILSGEVKNACGYIWVALKTQAIKERDRAWYGLGDVPRARAESQTLSDAESEGQQY